MTIKGFVIAEGIPSVRICLILLRITDKGSVPEMCICSIVLFLFDLKWCLHLSRSLFLCPQNGIQGHLVIVLSVTLFVCLSVCL